MFFFSKTPDSSKIKPQDKVLRDHVEGEKKQFVPEWSYASDRYYTNSDGERVKANEWNRTTWNPNQRVMNLNAQDFGNEFFWATTNRPAELFNYTFAWNHDKDFRDKRLVSFACIGSIGCATVINIKIVCRASFCWKQNVSTRSFFHGTVGY